MPDNDGCVSRDLSNRGLIDVSRTRGEKGDAVVGGRGCDKLSVHAKGEPQTRRYTPTSVSALIPCITLMACLEGGTVSPMKVSRGTNGRRRVENLEWRGKEESLRRIHTYQFRDGAVTGIKFVGQYKTKS